MRNIKWSLIWCFIFESSTITKREFISDFVVVVNYFIIFVYIIFIDLRLIFLIY